MSTIQEHAGQIFKALTPEQIAYAADAARGEYRGFAALHDVMDANMLLPDAENFDAEDTRMVARCNAIMDAVAFMIRMSEQRGMRRQQMLDYIRANDANGFATLRGNESDDELRKAVCILQIGQ